MSNKSLYDIQLGMFIRPKTVLNKSILKIVGFLKKVSVCKVKFKYIEQYCHSISLLKIA